MKVSESQVFNSKQQIHSLPGASGPVMHSPAVPRTHQAASPHPPAVSLTPQWTPSTAALLPYGAAGQLVNTEVHLETVMDG